MSETKDTRGSSEDRSAPTTAATSMSSGGTGLGSGATTASTGRTVGSTATQNAMKKLRNSFPDTDPTSDDSSARITDEESRATSPSRKRRGVAASASSAAADESTEDEEEEATAKPRHARATRTAGTASTARSTGSKSTGRTATGKGKSGRRARDLEQEDDDQDNENDGEGDFDDAYDDDINDGEDDDFVDEDDEDEEDDYAEADKEAARRRKKSNKVDSCPYPVDSGKCPPSYPTGCVPTTPPCAPSGGYHPSYPAPDSGAGTYAPQPAQPIIGGAAGVYQGDCGPGAYGPYNKNNGGCGSCCSSGYGNNSGCCNRSCARVFWGLVIAVGALLALFPFRVARMFGLYFVSGSFFGASGGCWTAYAALFFGWFLVYIGFAGLNWCSCYFVCLCRGLGCCDSKPRGGYGAAAVVVGAPFSLTQGCGGAGCGDIDCSACKPPLIECDCRYVIDWYQVIWILTTFMFAEFIEFLVRLACQEWSMPTIYYWAKLLLGTFVFYVSFRIARCVNLWLNLLLTSFVTLFVIHVDFSVLGFSGWFWLSILPNYILLFGVAALLALCFGYWRIQTGGWVAACGTPTCGKAGDVFYGAGAVAAKCL